MEKDMEHDETYFTMMMDALDGELVDADRGDLETHLRACPECQTEWNALLAIDMLFRQSPLLSPAVGFAERTLALLPNRRTRVWAMSAIYAALLVAGLIPLLVGIFIAVRYTPVLSDPAIVQQLWGSLAQMGQVGLTVVAAAFAGAGRFVVEQPAVVGWLIVLAGLVFLWGGVFQRLLVQPQRGLSRNEG